MEIVATKMKTQIIDISGMHCGSCEKIIEEDLSGIKNVDSVRASLKNRNAKITYEGELDLKNVARRLKKIGYELGREKAPVISRDPFVWKTFAIGLIVSVGLFLLVKLLEIDKIATGQAENSGVLYGLFNGLVAGFSTCMALIGGLVVSLTAKFRESNPEASSWKIFKPNIIFNLSRIVSFFLLGGILGMLGKALTFTPVMTGIMTIIAGIFMLLVGIQLSGIFPRINTITIPSKLMDKIGIKRSRSGKYSNKKVLILGAASFFLPCGFTQAMQIFAVSTGSPIAGALVMGLFAVGTSVGLMTAGGITSFIGKNKTKIFLRILGVMIAAMALMNISNGLNISGWRLLNLSGASGQSYETGQKIINLDFDGPYKQFNEKKITIKRGQKYTVVINPKMDGTGCMYAVYAPGLSEESPKILKKGREIRIEIEARELGKYQFVCPMGIGFDTEIIAEE